MVGVLSGFLLLMKTKANTSNAPEPKSLTKKEVKEWKRLRNVLNTRVANNNSAAVVMKEDMKSMNAREKYEFVKVNVKVGKGRPQKPESVKLHVSENGQIQKIRKATLTTEVVVKTYKTYTKGFTNTMAFYGHIAGKAAVVHAENLGAVFQDEVWARFYGVSVAEDGKSAEISSEWMGHDMLKLGFAKGSAEFEKWREPVVSALSSLGFEASSISKSPKNYGIKTSTSGKRYAVLIDAGNVTLKKKKKKKS